MSGIARKVNKYGRITIPIEIRKLLDIDTETDLELLEIENGISLTRITGNSCVFCCSLNHLIAFKRKVICIHCAKQIKRTPLPNEEASAPMR
ncbi:AbrB/MazE/SpoVT family DNA-binding domain-containing protein [Paenibacillus terrae]|uniref:SpoVT-AbrB domain-containing protein n=1 Tax=Paenibacillus terrae TaxID=159743 RepID=A0A0D7WY19_9BACL|nr:AbrB/MazE/SpoVT family DNA-binding domain-containing protein [Paenibacillus terrae]KJD43623.1 hypothetical protein QD47_21790 [Paenibacillus terrae]